ncbi:MAG: HAD family phosphatase [Oscillospiraceae bacterium]|nr:HAD family phosphatase [Oscillospiraceae bacterium]
MDIRLVAVDLDGTLLRNDKSLSPAAVRAVAHAAERGLEIVIATGRSRREFDHILRRLPAVRYAVCCTGACVLDCKTGEELFSSPLPAALAAEVWRRLQPFDILFEVFQDGHVYVDQAKMPRLDAYMAASRNPCLPGSRTGQADFDAWVRTQGRPVVKLHMFFQDTAQRDAAWDALRDLDAFLCCSDPVDLEVMAQGVDKGSGLAQLAGRLGLTAHQVLAVGDSGNDLGMLRYAGVRAVMANGEAALLELADLRLDDNEHDGAAKLLERLAKGERLTWN